MSNERIGDKIADLHEAHSRRWNAWFTQGSGAERITVEAVRRSIPMMLLCGVLSVVLEQALLNAVLASIVGGLGLQFVLDSVLIKMFRMRVQWQINKLELPPPRE